MKLLDTAAAVAISAALLVACLGAIQGVQAIAASADARDPTPATDRQPIQRGTATHDGLGRPWTLPNADGSPDANPIYQGWPYGQ